MKTVVFGKGFLGTRIAEALEIPLVEDRIENMADIYNAIETLGEFPEVIINCIGKTGRPNVDWCETNKPETYIANTHVPYLFAEFCKKSNIKLVHISSGCIYQGDNNGRGWSETDEPNFTGSFYSFTKAAAERILSAYDNVLTLRIRMPIDSDPNSRELLGKLLKYTKIISAPNSITVIDDFISVLKVLLERNSLGMYNVVNPQAITHEEILSMYEDEFKEKLNKIYISPEDLETLAPRSNCVLNTDKLQAELASHTVEVLKPTNSSLRETITKYVRKQKQK